MEHVIARSTPAASARQDPLGRLLFALAVLALALAPTQLTVAIKNLPLAPAEVVLLIAILVWAIRWCIVRDTTSLPPLANWLLVLAGALSVIGLLTDQQILLDLQHALGDKQGTLLTQIKALKSLAPFKDYLMDVVKLALYFLLLYTVFRASFTTPQRIRAAMTALLITTSLAVLLGVAQRILLQSQYQPDPLKRHTFVLQDPKETSSEFTEEVRKAPSRYASVVYTTVETPIEVSSTFGSWDAHGYHPSRNAYVGLLALVLPFALAIFAAARRALVIRIWIVLLLLGAAASLLAGYLVPAVLIGLMVTGIALGAGFTRGVLIGIAACLLVLLAIGGHNRREVLQEPFQLRISAEEAHFRYPGDDGQSGTRHLKKFWGEQLAALNLLRSDPRNYPPGDSSLTHRNPLFGVGMGQYQAKINMAYGSLGPVSSQRLEPDGQNGYLLTAVNMGLFGLAALLALFGAGIGQAYRLVRAGYAQPWSAALLGSLTALAVMTLSMNSLVRGLLVVIVALLAMTGSLAARHTAEAKEPEQNISRATIS